MTGVQTVLFRSDPVRSPLAWLEPSCIDKITAVTDGLAADVAAAKRQRAAKQPRPAQAVRLPWDPE